MPLIELLPRERWFVNSDPEKSNQKKHFQAGNNLLSRKLRQPTSLLAQPRIKTGQTI